MYILILNSYIFFLITDNRYRPIRPEAPVINTDLLENLDKSIFERLSISLFIIFNI